MNTGYPIPLSEFPIPHSAFALLQPILVVIWAWLLTGLLGVLAVSRKLPRGEARRLWFKFLSYALIVHGIVFAMAWRSGQFWPGLATLLAAGGLCEILRLHLRNPARRLAVVTGALPVYLVLAAGFVRFSLAVPLPGQMAVYTLVCVFDGFSQLSGQLFGRRKLAPAISPAKTVEGLAGGLAMALFTGVMLGHYLGFPPLIAATLALAVSLAALAGDLMASYYKRLQGAKDFSNLLPTHGGILDRFDSTLAAGALVFLLNAAWLDRTGTWRMALLGVGFLAILALSEILYRTGRLRAETTRKCSHLGASLLALALPALALTPVQAVLLGLVFLALMAAAKRGRILPSVHAIPRAGSLGSQGLPIGICISYCAYCFHGDRAWFNLAVLVLGVSDPCAWLVGSRWPWGRYHVLGNGKSLAGSGAFLASALGIVALFLWLGGPGRGGLAILLLNTAIISCGAALAEALTPRGLDNVTIPVTVLTLLAALC